MNLENVIRKFTSLSREKREHMGNLARQKVENEFDRNLIINSYLKKIKLICKEK